MRCRLNQLVRSGRTVCVTVKTVKVLGTSEASWHDAADEAVAQASETTDDIHGVEVEDWTADAVRFWAK